MCGQAEQELGKGVGMKDGKKFGRQMGLEVGMQVTGKIGRWEVGGTQEVGRYVQDKEENDEEKDVGKKVDTCTQTVEASGHEIVEVVPQ